MVVGNQSSPRQNLFGLLASPEKFHLHATNDLVAHRISNQTSQQAFDVTFITSSRSFDVSPEDPTRVNFQEIVGVCVV